MIQTVISRRTPALRRSQAQRVADYAMAKAFGLRVGLEDAARVVRCRGGAVGPGGRGRGRGRGRRPAGPSRSRSRSRSRSGSRSPRPASRERGKPPFAFGPGPAPTGVPLTGSPLVLGGCPLGRNFCFAYGAPCVTSLQAEGAAAPVPPTRTRPQPPPKPSPKPPAGPAPTPSPNPSRATPPRPTPVRAQRERRRVAHTLVSHAQKWQLPAGGGGTPVIPETLWSSVAIHASDLFDLLLQTKLLTPIYGACDRQTDRRLE